MTTTMHLPNVCEYSQVTPDNQSRKTRILTGYELAGSMARHTNEKWSVRFHSDSAYHGRSFLTLKAAKAYFYKCTGPKIKGTAS